MANKLINIEEIRKKNEILKFLKKSLLALTNKLMK